MSKLFLLILFLLVSNSWVEAQPSFEELANKYLSAIGGKSKWQNLKSRVSDEEYEIFSTGSGLEVLEQTLPFTEVFNAPKSYMKLWNHTIFWSFICQTDKYAWTYSGEQSSIFFLDQKYLKKNNDFPEIRILEFLNFKQEKEVVKEGIYFKVLLYHPVKKTLVSVYFNRESFLVEKHSFKTSAGFHEYFYSDFKEKDGYYEPYRIEHYINNKKSNVIIVKSINYNIAINDKLFSPPIKDRKSRLIKLEEPLEYPSIYAEKP